MVHSWEDLINDGELFQFTVGAGVVLALGYVLVRLLVRGAVRLAR